MRAARPRSLPARTLRATIVQRAMCGRYTLVDPARFLAEFSILEKRPRLEPRYNVAPDQLVPVVRITAPGRAPSVDLLVWGLVPSWAKHENERRAAGFINARVETVAEKPAFAGAFRLRRCLLVADGFYEWKKAEKRTLPYLVRTRDSAPLAIAGIWEPRAAALGRVADSCAIITMPARPPVDALHNRMPAILAHGDVATWLDPDVHDIGVLKTILDRGPSPELELELVPVDVRVNSPANDDAGCIEPAIGHGVEREPQRRLF
jgi:putative SOS response-associated peptidase YedK